MLILNLPEIYELKRCQPKDAPADYGVYFIFNCYDELIYIGKSNNIKNRVHTHLLLKGSSPIKDKKEIVSISYILLKDYKYSTEGIEKIYIDYYNPKYNNIKPPEIWEIITPELRRQLTAHVPMR